MTTSKKKLYFLLAIALVIVIIGYMVFRSRQAQNNQGAFEFAELTRGKIENIVDSTGTLSAMETIEVGSQVSGIVKVLHVDFNGVVKKDQILAELDRTPFEISVRDAEASLMRSKAKMEQARSEHQRNQPLFDKGHISETDYLSTKTVFQTSQADTRQAEAALSKARINLGYTVIRSPIDGTIIERTINLGQTIAASFQAPKLFVIAQDLKRMQIKAAVDESDIGLIKEGQNARFTVQSYPDITFTGLVRQIRLQPTTIQNVVNYTVVIDAENDKGLLLPGMTATVDFLVEEKPDVLLIPSSALTYAPSAEVMAQYGMTIKPEPSRSAGQNGSAEHAGRAGKPAANMAKVYYLDDKGKLQMAVLHKGISDGKLTEVVDSPVLKVGMKVITGFLTQQVAKKASNQGGGFFPRPPGGGPR